MNKLKQYHFLIKALLLLGFFCSYKKNWAQQHTIQLNEIILSSTDSNKLIDIKKAYNYYNNNKIKKAYKTLQQSKQNNSYEYFFFLGYIELKNNKPQYATANFNKALRVTPTATCYFYNAIAFSKLKNYNTALSNYYNAIKLDSLMYQAYNNIALMKIENQGTGNLHQRDLEQSKTILLKSIQQEPNDKNIYFNLSLVCMSLNQFNEALTYLNKTIAIDSFFDKAIYCRALTNYYLRAYNNALSDFYTCKNYNYNVEISNEFITLIEKIIKAKEK